MKKRAVTLVVGFVTMASAVGLGQMIIRGTEISGQAPGNSASISAVHIDTLDRDIVPLIREDKNTKVDANTQESQSITKARLNDGSYFNWRDRTTVTREVAPGQTVSSSALVETDREGQSHVTQRTDTTISRSTLDEQEQARVYRRNSSGELVLDHVADANTVNKGRGMADTTSDQRIMDVNGNLIQVQQINSTTVNSEAKGRVTSSDSKTVDHLTGQPAITVQQTTSVVMHGNTKQSESVVRQPGQFGWEATSRTATTETKASDGSLVRETTVSGLPTYSTKTGNESFEPMTSQTKIVEREVHQPDGTIVQQRDVFHRDVNGEWVPETFSTKEADKGLNN
jgi:hypothetical protein